MRVAIATVSVDPSHGGPAYSVPAVSRNLEIAGADSVLLTRGTIQGLPLRSMAGLLDSDVVHCFGIWTPFHHAICAATRLLKAPLVLSPIGMLEPWALAHSPYRKRIALALYQRSNLERAAVLHATASSEAANLRALGLRAPIATIPHGVDVPQEGNRPARRGRAKRRTVLYLSRIHPKKGLLALVEAWSQLRPVDWHVIVAGPDEDGHRAEVEAAVHHAGLDGVFTFTGHVEGATKEALFSQADLFVLPTYSENFGNAVGEALAHGLPVITTTGAPWRELTTTRSGWWIAPGVEPLAATLREALDLSSQVLDEMGMRGRAMVEERYSWEQVADKYMKLYSWILGGGAAPEFVSLAPA